MTEDIPSSVIKVLRYFVRDQKFSYVDRIANALNPEPALMALKDALRVFRSIHASQTQKDEKSYLPRIPSQDDIKQVIDGIVEDITYAHKLAIYALTIGSSNEKTVKAEKS